MARIFAHELGVAYDFRVVPDLMSASAAAYAGNPALRLPILEAASGTWFGTLNICRELTRQSERTLHIVWPEHLEHALLANAQEFSVQAMTTEVALVMAKLAHSDPQNAHQTKQQASLLNLLAWLEANVNEALAALPAQRELSYFETTLFCLMTHLEFRQVLSVTTYPALGAFCAHFATRDSARETPFFFDP